MSEGNNADDGLFISVKENCSKIFTYLSSLISNGSKENGEADTSRQR